MCIKHTIRKHDDLCLLGPKVVTGESVVRSEDQMVIVICGESREQAEENLEGC